MTLHYLPSTTSKWATRRNAPRRKPVATSGKFEPPLTSIKELPSLTKIIQRHRPSQVGLALAPAPGTAQGVQGAGGPAGPGAALLHRVREVVRDGREPCAAYQRQAAQEEVSSPPPSPTIT